MIKKMLTASLWLVQADCCILQSVQISLPATSPVHRHFPVALSSSATTDSRGVAIVVYGKRMQMHSVWYLFAKLHSVFTGRPDFFHTPAPAPWVPHHVPSSGTWCGCSRVRSGWTGMVPGGPWSPPFPLALHRRCLADGGTCCAPPHGKRMQMHSVLLCQVEYMQLCPNYPTANTYRAC